MAMGMTLYRITFGDGSTTIISIYGNLDAAKEYCRTNFRGRFIIKIEEVA